MNGSMPVDSFAQVLQFSISPIALISGASLLLLSVTNRFGRTIDRSRALSRELDSGTANAIRESHIHQLRVLLRRSRLLRSAILCLTTSILISGIMILGVFLQVFAGWPMKTLVLALLCGSIFTLCASVVFLFRDVSAGLYALELDIKRHL